MRLLVVQQTLCTMRIGQVVNKTNGSILLYPWYYCIGQVVNKTTGSIHIIIVYPLPRAVNRKGGGTGASLLRK